MTKMTVFLAGTALALLVAVPGAHAVPAIGVSSGTSLFTFNTTAPLANGPLVAISGLQAGESIASVDFRPATGMLYGLSTSQRLYTINATTGVAVAGPAFSTALAGSQFGISFNPNVDRLRILSTSGNNYRVNVDTGAVITDTSLTFATGGGTPSVVALGYSGQAPGAQTGSVPGTDLFDINSTNNALYVQRPANDGTLIAVGSGLGVSGLRSFDIDGTTGTGYATNGTALYQVNASTGTASLIGAFTASNVTSITIGSAAATAVPEPMSLALLAGGLAAVGFTRRRAARA